MVGTRASSPVSMVGAQGVLRICGDSGDDYDPQTLIYGLILDKGVLLYS